MISGIPIRPWPLCNDLASKVSLGPTRNSFMATAEAVLPIAGAFAA